MEKPVKRILANFGLVNVFVAIICFVVTSRCLHFLSVTIDANAPVTIKVLSGRGDLGFEGVGLERVTTVQPTDLDGDVVLRFIGGAPSKLIKVELSEHVVLTRVWEGDALTCQAEGDIRLPIERARWGVCEYFWPCLLAGEFLIFLLALAISYLSRSDVEGRWQDSAILAFVGSVLVFVLIPLQTLLGNPDALPVTTTEVILASFLPSIVLALSMFAMLEVCRRFGGQVYGSIAAAVIAYEYLEVGPLSMGCPPLDGDAIVYKDLIRGALDALVLVIIGLVMVALRNRRISHWVSMAVLVLATCSLFDAGSTVPSVAFRSDIVDRPVKNAAVIQSTVHSPKKNVMLQFLDFISIEHVVDALRRSEELRNAFDGFYFCTNNVGMYRYTVESVPAIMTGSYHDVDSADYVLGIFSSSSIMAPYLKRGAKVMVAPGCLNYGYATETQAVDSVESCETFETSPFFRRMLDQQQWSIYEVSKFRMTPYALKYYVYGLIVYGWRTVDDFAEESWIFPHIANAPIDPCCGLTLHSYHTRGAHPPYGRDHNGEFDPTLFAGYRAEFEKSWYALSQTAKLFASLKERDLYDNHFIFLISDHGGSTLFSEGVPRLTDAPTRAFPFLMFKPIGSHGPLRFVESPTSHSRIATAVRELAERNLSAEDTIACLTQTNRIYRESRGSVAYEYRFGSDCYGPFEMIVLNHDESRSLVKFNHLYSFSNAKDRPPVEVKEEGAYGMLYEGVRLSIPPCLYVLRTGQPNVPFEVELAASLRVQKARVDTDLCRWILKDLVSGNAVETEIRGGQREIKKLTLRTMSDDQGCIRFSHVSTGMCSLMSIKVLEGSCSNL